MPIPPSTAYAAVKVTDGIAVIMHKGNKKNMLRMVKQNGGNKAGWFLYLETQKQVGDNVTPPAMYRSN